MTEVYIVSEGCYEDRKVVGVYTTLQRAMAHVDAKWWSNGPEREIWMGEGPVDASGYREDYDIERHAVTA